MLSCEFCHPNRAESGNEGRQKIGLMPRELKKVAKHKDDGDRNHIWKRLA